MLRCKLFGHTPPMQASTVSYGRVIGQGVDHTGCERAVVYATCDRCGEDYLAIRIHLPKVNDAEA